MNINSGTIRKYKILIAEDNLLNQKLIATLLAKNNYTVLTAFDGDEAFSAWQKESPDLILMDVEMPKVNGCEAVLKIRESEKNKDLRVPIIALTGHYLKEDVDRILNCGMDDYLPKPFNISVFMEKINYLLNGKK